MAGQGEKHGPVLTPMVWIPKEGTSSHEAAAGLVTDGVPGYPKGTPGVINEVTFDVGGKFGKVPPVKE